MLAALVSAIAMPGAAQAASGSTSPPAAQPAIPPDLAALEQKMLALQISSERFSVTMSVSENPHPKGLGGVGPVFGRASAIVSSIFTAAGEVGFAPVRASFQVSFLGLHYNARLIGSTLYIEEPSLARIDGGRPWLELPDERLGEAIGGGPSAEAEGGLEPASGFGATVDTIARATSIQEVGASSVSGQAANEFALVIPVERIGKLSHRQLRALHKVFAPDLDVQLFLAEDGLPLRERLVFTLRHRRGRLIEQSDVLAVDVPVQVQAPPAAETLTDAALKKLLSRRAKHRRKIVAVHHGRRHSKRR
jgi:hypothetical protein